MTAKKDGPVSQIRFTPASIRNGIGCEFIQGPFNGGGYWYLIYDHPAAGVFETHSVMTHRMSSLTLEQWVEEGRAFVGRVQDKHP